MGSDKASCRLAAAARRGRPGEDPALFPQVLIIADDSVAYGDSAYRRGRSRSDKGPSAGSRGALRQSIPAHFCIACDMPLANPTVIAYLCSSRAITMCGAVLREGL